jgi:hypothetical protein
MRGLSRSTFKPEELTLKFTTSNKLSSPFQSIPVLIALLTPSFIAMSAPGEWMPDALLIENIIVEGDTAGKAIIIIKGGVPTAYIPSACNSPYNTIDLSTTKGRSQLAVALSAYASGKPVKLALQCIGDRPLVSHIMF